MKKTLILILLAASTVVTSCMDKDIYDPSKQKDDNSTQELDLSFKFSMKTEKAITISATDALGNPGEAVQFNIYLQAPLTDEGISHDIAPAYTGYTGKDGLLRTSIVIPADVKRIYVYPVTPGFGEIQAVDVTDNISLNFHGVPLPSQANSRSVATRAIDLSQLNSQSRRIATRYNIFTPFVAADANANGILIPGKSPLVTSEQLPNDFLNLVNSWYPEQSFQDEEQLNLSSDLVVTDDAGAEIWITYISDGGFSEGSDNEKVYSSLLYYNYEPGDLTSVFDVYKGEQTGTNVNNTGLHITMLFPNVNSRQCAPGIKVQLLYWDKDKETYSTLFPKGTHIGFVTARSAYKKLDTPIDNAASYWFAQPVSAPVTNSHSPNYELFYSTPCLNGKGLDISNAIIRSCPDYGCMVAGMDVRYWDDVKSDRDYNDVLFKIVSNPPKGVTPENEIDVNPVSPYDVQYGTLAFEDLWPSKGDYDFNDLVLDYTYKRIKSSIGITELQLDFLPLARGGSIKSAFCIELPFPSGMVKSVSGATLEPGNEKATLIVWDDTDKVFGGKSGLINTYKNATKVETGLTTIKVTLSAPLADTEIKFLKFNPFIYVNGARGHEIHLVDYPPTPKVDTSLFGNDKDRSDITKGIYYRMDNTYPWALDIPRISSEAPSWRYPLEGENITGVYLNYEKWIHDKSDYNWFDSSVPGNVDNDKLY